MSTITFPFFPMRPRKGFKLTPGSMINVINDYYLQPKLDGDRVVVSVEDGAVALYNRRGSRYSFRASNADKLAEALPSGTILDCEIYGGVLYPFECIRYGDEDLRASYTAARCEAAEEACRIAGVPFLFGQLRLEDCDAIVEGKFERGGIRGAAWEGVVAKRKGARYRFGATATDESPTWFKFKIHTGSKG